MGYAPIKFMHVAHEISNLSFMFRDFGSKGGNESRQNIIIYSTHYLICNYISTCRVFEISRFLFRNVGYVRPVIEVEYL